MPVAPDLCGAALDERYELSELIGEGAFGRVYRGRDRRLDRPVAVKVIKPWWGEDPGWAAAFERETRLLAQLCEPGIVQIHDVGHAPEGLFFVSELVDGEDLATRLRRAGGAGLSPGDAREIALGLCRALAGAHARRIVHRDVKPANVLLARDGAIKLADFGVARLADATTADGSLVVGTPRYMAPECSEGGPGVPASDVYSVGVVLYEMLAGRPPFTGDSPLALALGHLHEAPPPLPATVDPSLVAIVARSLAKDPADRYPDAGAMAEALERCDGAAADATRSGARRGPRVTFHPAARRRSIGLLALAGALLGAIVAAALLLGPVRGTPARTARGRVDAPDLVAHDLAAARARLAALGLRASVHEVPDPGARPGTVIGQRPAAGAVLGAHADVRLDVARAPHWRTVATFTGRDPAAMRIHGRRWRIIASATSTHSCSWLVFCHSSSVRITRGDAPLESIALHDGIDDAHVVDSGPGTYRLTVDPASGSTRWSIRVQDDY